MKNIKNATVIAASSGALILVAAALTFIVVSNDSGHAAASDDTAAASNHERHDRTGLAAADKNGDGIVYQGGMHPWIVEDEPGQCPVCGMNLMPVRVDQATDGSINIDAATLQNIGVRTVAVTVEPIRRELRTTGRFQMDERGSHTVSLKISGWVEKLHADFNGAIVRKGQPLLDLYSPDLVATQEEYLLARRNLERLEGSPSADDARRLVEAARRRLAYWDLTEDQIRGIEESGRPQRTLKFYAPSSGEVMNKQVVEGQYVDAGRPLMNIVDIDQIWLIADIYEQDLNWVRPGLEAVVELPYRPGETYRGRIDYIYHMLENETRTARARIILPGGHQAPFKPGMYATVRVIGGESEPLPVVPEEAVVRSGDRDVVVLALGDGRFLPTEVVTGEQSSGKVHVLSGLQGGETVVTSAQFLIDSEARLQSAVGAMTSGHDHSSMAGQPERPSGAMPQSPSADAMTDDATPERPSAMPAGSERSSQEVIGGE